MNVVPDRLTLVSRGSRLALRQTELVAERVRRAHPEIDVAVVTVSTRGDRDRRPFAEIGGKGLFVKEVEAVLLEGAADAAVHSAKDLTSVLAPGCALVCIPERARAYDVVVGGAGGDGRERLASLAAGARVGTSSMRRRALLAESRPDVTAVDLRGNLETRVRKVTDGQVDAAVLAAAGLDRLDGLGIAFGTLDPDWWVPAPAQGALAVEALAARDDVAALFSPLDDDRARAEVECERAFAAALEGGCSVPLGCLARVRDGRLVATGYLGDPFAERGLRDRISGSPADARSLGHELATAILDAGGDDILADVRAAPAPEVTGP